VLKSVYFFTKHYGVTTNLSCPEKSILTLDQVRPQPRQQNEYVDTPHSPLGGGNKSVTAVKNVVATPSVIPRDRVVLPSRKSAGNSIIRHQPISTSLPLKKDVKIEKDVESGEQEQSSIYCFKCNKCMCGVCTALRELPQRWLCGVKCLPETCVEYCMCCVKGIFYHCSTDDQDSEYECDSEPCACCSRPHCCQRWTCMLAMSLCLPCMCLYLPAKCALSGCTAVHDKCTRPGCTCKPVNTNSSKKSSSRSKLDSQYRGLLVESDRESSSVSNS